MIRPNLSEEEFRLFSEWLADEYGLCFPTQKRDILRARLEPFRAELGFDTFEQLFFHLKFHPERAAERQRLVPHLTNNESYFFRERGQLEVLQTEVLPAIRERLRPTRRREVRILSAGCAAGEEAYTLAIIGRKTGLFGRQWKLRVTGLDVDPQALARAQAAEYTNHAFRGLADEVRQEYFCATGRRWRICPSIRGGVEFRQGNLVDDTWVSQIPPQDVIFCRNVLIYFDADATARAAAAFYRALTPGGYLFLGHAETLSRTATNFQAVRRPGAIFYVRPEEESMQNAER